MKFAHIADVHLGAFRIRELRELNLQAFLAALEKCMEEEVDFLIIAGDLFHNPIPDTDIVLQAARGLKNLKESGIEVFVTYGSHDFTVKKASMLDILAETGLVKKAMRYEVEEGRITEQVEGGGRSRIGGYQLPRRNSGGDGVSDGGILLLVGSVYASSEWTEHRSANHYILHLRRCCGAGSEDMGWTERGGKVFIWKGEET